jgi:hypothetical protein
MVKISPRAGRSLVLAAIPKGRTENLGFGPRNGTHQEIALASGLSGLFFAVNETDVANCPWDQLEALEQANDLIS